MEQGERGIPLAVAACRERLISCEPVAADLEAAFLALTDAPTALPDRPIPQPTRNGDDHHASRHAPPTHETDPGR